MLALLRVSLFYTTMAYLQPQPHHEMRYAFHNKETTLDTYKHQPPWQSENQDITGFIGD